MVPSTPSTGIFMYGWGAISDWVGRGSLHPHLQVLLVRLQLQPCEWEGCEVTMEFFSPAAQPWAPPDTSNCPSGALVGKGKYEVRWFPDLDCWNYCSDVANFIISWYYICLLVFQKYFNLLFQSPLSDSFSCHILFLTSYFFSSLWLQIYFFLWSFLALHLSAQSIMAHWELFFCSRGWEIIVHLWRGHGWVKASWHDQHLFTLSWSSLMWQRWPPLSFRINLASSNSFSFCKKLGTETVLKKFCYGNVVGALAILFNRVVNR